MSDWENAAPVWLVQYHTPDRPDEIRIWRNSFSDWNGAIELYSTYDEAMAHCKVLIDHYNHLGLYAWPSEATPQHLRDNWRDLCWSLKMGLTR